MPRVVENEGNLHRAGLFSGVLLSLSVAGCTSIPQGRTAVDAVDVKGASKLDGEDVEEKLATAPTPKFFGLFRGIVYEYSLFDAHVLGWDLARVERYYRARGYYDAHARAGRVLSTSEHHVRVEVIVEEGEPVLTSDVRMSLDGSVPPAAADALTKKKDSILPKDALLDEDKLEELEKGLTHVLEDQGFAKAATRVRSEVDLPNRKAIVLVAVTAGKPYVFGKLKIEGLGTLPDAQVRRAIDLQEGAPYSRTEIERAEQSLLDLGVVGTANIVPELDDEKRIANLVAKLEPTKLRAVRLGGGFELDALKTDVHLHGRWQDKNFFGGLKQASIDFTPGVVFFPTRIPGFQAPTMLLPEEKLRLELRIPGAFEARTTAFIRPEFNIFPSLVKTKYVAEDPVNGYREAKTTQGVERLYGKKLRAVLSHSFQLENPFAYAGTLNPLLNTIIISYPELLLTLDLRNDAVHPRKGIYLSNDFQIAGLGGDPVDVRVQPEARGYVPITRGITFAARVSVGFLFPLNYKASTEARDVQIVFFRGFFSGGPTQNRGYPLRGVGPRGNVPAYDSTLGALQAAKNCTASDQRQECAVPLGGLSLWEASLELRVVLSGPLSTVAFCDTSDVSATRLKLNFMRPHLSCGPGLRYDTPVGPIRADVGFRIPGAQVFSGDAEQVTDIFGVPVAVQVGLGEAF